MVIGPIGEFALLMTMLEEQPDTLELIEVNRAFEDRWTLIKALGDRALLLEKFYRYVAARHAEADDDIAKGTKSERDAAVVEFAEAMGLGIRNKLSKQFQLLAHYANALLDSGDGRELAAAMLEHRRAEVEIERQLAAVSVVQEKFGIASLGAARKQLTDARRVIAKGPAGALFNWLPIPGWETGEN
jgi:hypothetical protein